MNNAPQSAGSAVVHDKNTKEHLKNKVNQKDLPQLITNISATSLKLKNFVQKVLGKLKKTKSVNTGVIPFIPKQDLHPSDTCLYHNKTMPDISDPELYSPITNMYKPPKILTFQKLSGPLGLSGLKSLHGFVTLGGRMVPIAFFVFYLAIKLREVLVWKIFTENHVENGQQQ